MSEATLARASRASGVFGASGVLASPRLRGLALAAAGALALVVALSRQATVLGELFAVIAVLASCLGWGTAVARLVSAARPSSRSEPISATPTSLEPAVERAVLGLATLLVIGALAARFGLATRTCLLALVAAGLAAALHALLASPAPSRAPRVYSWPQLIVIAAGLAFLLCAELFDLSPVLSDGKTHAFSVARLWQVSELPMVRGLLGGQTIGEALFALGGDPRSAGMFDAGASAILVVLMLASVCARPRLAQGFILLAVLALPVVFHSDPPNAPTARWTATLFLLAGGLRLRRAVALGRPDRGVFLLALALVCLRTELAVAASFLVLGGLLLPRASSENRTKRRTALYFLLWFVPLCGALVFFRARPFAVPAIIVSGLVGAALAQLLVMVCGFARWRDELAFALAAAIGTALLASTRLAGVLQQATFPVWFVLVALILTRAFIVEASEDISDDDEATTADASREASDADDRSSAPLRGPAGVLLAFVVASTIFMPLLQAYRHHRIIARGMRVVQVSADLYALGFGRATASGTAELQARVPAGASLGFWGENPAGLDFRRNPVVDLSWPASARSNTAYLSPLSRHRITRVEYILVSGPPEYLPAASWNESDTTTTDIETMVDLVAESRSAKLFRVRPSAPQLK